jgi:phage baseplate assembly protein gpV
MAALTAADVTVTVNPEDIDRSPDGRVGMRTFPTVQFGNAALTYVALGIPMPAIGKFGFHFAIKRAYIEQPGDGYIYSFDRANHKLRIFLGAAQAAITVANHVNIAVPAPTAVLTSKTVAIEAHSHGLEVASNSAGDPVVASSALYANSTGPRLQANQAANVLIPGGVAANGGVANATATGNVSSNAISVTAGANLTDLTHTVTGGGAVAEAPLAEMDNTVAPAATTLYMEMVGR